MATTRIHPIIQRSRCILEKVEQDRDGFLLANSNDCVDLWVTRKLLDRGLSAMNAIIREAENRGFSVSLVRKWGTHTQFEKEGVIFLVALKEQCTRKKHIPTSEEREQMRKGDPLGSIPKFDLTPNGKLIFELHGDQAYMRRGIRTRWVEGKRQSIEQLIPEIIEGLEAMAVCLVEAQKEYAEKGRRVQEERFQRETEHDKARDEAKRFEQLHEMASAWVRNRQAGEFLDAVERDYRERGVEMETGIASWLQWARQKVEANDPVRIHFRKRPDSGGMAHKHPPLADL